MNIRDIISKTEPGELRDHIEAAMLGMYYDYRFTSTYPHKTPVKITIGEDGILIGAVMPGNLFMEYLPWLSIDAVLKELEDGLCNSLFD